MSDSGDRKYDIIDPDDPDDWPEAAKAEIAGLRERLAATEKAKVVDARIIEAGEIEIPDDNDPDDIATLPFGLILQFADEDDVKRALKGKLIRASWEATRPMGDEKS